jgi:hypothetical protein
MSTTSRRRLGLVDTDPAIERRLADAYRQMTVAERLQRLDQYTRDMRRLSWRMLQQTRADLTPDERLRLWLAIQYGPDLANRVHAYCRERDR